MKFINIQDRKEFAANIGQIEGIAPIYNICHRGMRYAWIIGNLVLDNTNTLHGEPRTPDLVQQLNAMGYQTEEMPELIPDNITIELPLEGGGWSEDKINNFVKLVNSKYGLLRKALRADEIIIEKDEENGTLKVGRCGYTTDGEQTDAYLQLIVALANQAQKHKVVAQEREVENEKYAFRCFLLRLGFIGDAYKTARKILLAPFEGNGSWKTPRTAEG